MPILNCSAESVHSRSSFQHRPKLSEPHRQASLDREVFYFDNDRRKEIVTYKPYEIGSLAKKFGLNKVEKSVYTSSLMNLCDQLARVSKSTQNSDQCRSLDGHVNIEKVIF